MAAAEKPRQPQQKLSWGLSFGLGATAGAAAKTAVAPIERVRLVLQTTEPGQGYRSGLRAMVAEGGAKGLWRGNELAVVRATLYKGLLFSTQDKLAGVLGSHELAGAGAGLVAHGVTYPMDLLRTRVSAAIAAGEATRTVSGTLRNVVRAEGILALYRGAPATVLGGVVQVRGRTRAARAYKRGRCVWRERERNHTLNARATQEFVRFGAWAAGVRGVVGVCPAPA